MPSVYGIQKRLAGFLLDVDQRRIPGVLLLYEKVRWLFCEFIRHRVKLSPAGCTRIHARAKPGARWESKKLIAVYCPEKFGCTFIRRFRFKSLHIQDKRGHGKVNLNGHGIEPYICILPWCRFRWSRHNCRSDLNNLT